MISRIATHPRLRFRFPRTDIYLEFWHWLPAFLIGRLFSVRPLNEALTITLLVVGALAGLAVLNTPLLRLVLMLFLGPRAAWEQTFIAGPIGSNTTGQLILYLAIASWLLYSMRRGRIMIHWNMLNIPLFAFITMGAISLGYAVNPIFGFKEVAKWVQILLVIWIIFDTTQKYEREKVINMMIILLLASGLVQGLQGIWQFALRGAGPGHFGIFGRLYRATGTFQQPNPFGGFISLNLFIAIGVMIGLVSVQLKDREITVASILQELRISRPLQAASATTLILLTALIGSWSRGAWIGFIVACFCLIMLTPKNRRRGIRVTFVSTVVGGTLFATGLVPSAITDRLLGFMKIFSNDYIAYTPESHSVLERLAHWQAAINMAGEKPWFGHGLGNYEVVYNFFMIPGWTESLGHAHNYYLNLLAEVGVIGLCVYIYMWASIFWLTIRTIKRADLFGRGVSLGLLGAWIALSVHHILDNIYVKNIHLHLGVMFALLLMLQISADEKWSSESKAAEKQAMHLYSAENKAS